MQIYVHRNNQQLGPFTEAEIRAQLAAGTISLQDHVWWQGQASWLPLGQTSLVRPDAPALGIPAVPQAAVPLHPMQAGQTSQLAIWSLVCACLTLLCGIFTLVPALIMGHMSLAEIKRHPGMQGRGLAIAALVISYVMLAIAVVVVGAIVVLGALGNNVQDIFKTISSQLAAQQAASDNSTTNTDQSTNAPDSTTPTATPVPSPDQSTNSATATPANQ